MVRMVKESGVRESWVSGSVASASNPQDTKIISGVNVFSAFSVVVIIWLMCVSAGVFGSIGMLMILLCEVFPEFIGKRFF